MTIRELADCLMLAEKTVYGLDAEYKIPRLTTEVSWRFRKSEIAGWVIAQEQGRA